jgi:protease I
LWRLLPFILPPRQGDKFPVDRVVSEASASDYDGLVLPEGVANPDFLRMDPDAVGFARDFFEQGKPVGVICHGPGRSSRPTWCEAGR